MKNILLLCIAILLTGCSVANHQRLHTPSYDFSRIKTFTFDTKNCGIVGSPAAEKNEMIAYIKQEMENNLKAKALIPVRVHPDTFMRFGLILKSNGKDIDPITSQTLKDATPVYPSTFDYKSGTLILDAVEPFYGDVIWRGAIDTKITSDMPPPEKKEKLKGYIKLLLKDFVQLYNVQPPKELNKESKDGKENISR